MGASVSAGLAEGEGCARVRRELRGGRRLRRRGAGRRERGEELCGGARRRLERRGAAVLEAIEATHQSGEPCRHRCRARQEPEPSLAARRAHESKVALRANDVRYGSRTHAPGSTFEEGCRGAGSELLQTIKVRTKSNKARRFRLTAHVARRARESRVTLALYRGGAAKPFAFADRTQNDCGLVSVAETR